ncbi:MAG TPA: 1-(5-phosphoribosyl)-5-[(5-phosphoribosylamino)methylideneamino] imidazole-4-carboxamide isomerase [Gaiellaceae bacterium]|jgi:phosphoribosylformimino-5-aminoimidazole carboxamide ribotide isomerase|nr:1-(5-phosphoribosyl)-5-[(5-phosphoribosylamino)methylideneamino] imidazole-4-carboxamide isomerase [Gaiellaceae bacterium]
MPQEERVLQVIPAVDVLGDEAVRLVRGEFDRIAVREPDPFALVARVVEAGAQIVHVVDLTAARAGGVRPELFSRAAEAARGARIQASGGVRTVADAERLASAGAARVVVGTAAFAQRALLDALVDALGERLVVALDVRGGVVAVRGWERDSGFDVEAAVERCLAAGVRRLLCTAIDRDGTLAGPALELLARVVGLSGLPVLAAGGIRSSDDLEAVAETGCEAAIVGRALLEGGVPLSALATRA